MTARGIVLPLTDEQRLARALYLAKLAPSSTLDRFVRGPFATCRDIFYRLRDHNGGADPTAPDSSTEWTEPDEHGVQHARRTCDCSGADAWIAGHDRYTPLQMAAAVGYGGFWNTNSKILDATRVLGPKSGRRCFVAEDKPRRGLIVVCKSGAPGHKIGHEETIIECPEPHLWNPNDRACWDAIKTSGSRGSGKTANGPSTARGWFRTGALFLHCVLEPTVAP